MSLGFSAIILSDWDMASELIEEGEAPNSATLHRTGALPFMTTDLLVTPPPPHYYHHDLESFLIWAAVHYDVKKLDDRRLSCWLCGPWGDQNQALTLKLSLFGPSSGGNVSKEAIVR